MMWWYGHGMGGWGLALMLIGNVLFWAVIIIGVIALIRYLARGDRQRRQRGPVALPSNCLPSASLGGDRRAGVSQPPRYVGPRVPGGCQALSRRGSSKASA